MSVLVLALLLLALYLLYVRWRLLRPLDRPLPPDLPDDASGVDAWLERRDAREAPLQPGCGSSVQFAARARGKRAPVVVVYLHGWGASPPELAPVDTDIAEALGATLLRFRLSAHGLRPTERGAAAMVEGTSHATLRRDAAAAYALARLLGERVVLVGCSTGGSLAMWLSAQPWVGPELAALVLISPGFRLAKLPPAASTFSWLLLALPRALATKLIELANGGKLKRHGNSFAGERDVAHARVWTRVYPIGAVLHPIGVYVVNAATLRPAGVRVPVLAWANPRDSAVAFDATAAAVGAMPRGQLEVIDDSDGVHVICGDIGSPHTSARVSRRSAAFLRGVLDGA